MDAKVVKKNLQKASIVPLKSTYRASPNEGCAPSPSNAHNSHCPPWRLSDPFGMILASLLVARFMLARSRVKSTLCVSGMKCA